MSEPAAPPHEAGPRVESERSPVDVLRLVLAAVVLVALVTTDLLIGDAVTSFLEQLFSGVTAFPTWLITAVVVASRLLAAVLLLGGTVAALVHRRSRLLLTCILAMVLAGVVFALLERLTTAGDAPLATTSGAVGPLGGEGLPTAAGLATLAAVATAAAPWVNRRGRRIAWAAVIATAAARFLTAPVSVDSTLALVTGWLAGSAVLVALGGPVRRPNMDAVADGLRSVGVPVTEIHKASVDARGSTPYFATDADGRSLFVKALGADERSADLLFRAYRKVSPHDLGDERSFSSLRRAVEHEALVALSARDLGVRTPRFVALATVEPDAFVLAYEGIEGSSLDGVPAEQFDDDLLGAVWSQIGLLRSHRVAHRDLRLANLFRAADGQIWIIDFGFSELAASDLLLATDLAELLSSLTLVVGPERAVQAGVDAVGADAITTALPRLEPFALSGATRAGMKERPGLLDELRTHVDGATGGR